jgi:uncharacterized OsmC-like protein
MDAETIKKTIEAWEAEPQQAQSTPTVTAHSDDGQAVIAAGPFTWRADLPGPLGGSNQAPSPTALLLGALVGCAVVFVRDTLGPQLGVPVDGVSATARCHADARGLLGIGGAGPDLQGFELEVAVSTPAGSDGVATLAKAWEERCPIYLAVTKANPVALSFSAAT